MQIRRLIRDNWNVRKRSRTESGMINIVSLSSLSVLNKNLSKTDKCFIHVRFSSTNVTQREMIESSTYWLIHGMANWTMLRNEWRGIVVSFDWLIIQRAWFLLVETHDWNIPSVSSDWLLIHDTWFLLVEIHRLKYPFTHTLLHEQSSTCYRSPRVHYHECFIPSCSYTVSRSKVD